MANDNNPTAPASSPSTFIENIDITVVDLPTTGVKVAMVLTWKDGKRVESLLFDVDFADQLCQFMADRVIAARRIINTRSN